MRIFTVFFLIFCLGCLSINSIELKCAFEIRNWEILSWVYQCVAEYQGNLIVDRSKREILAITGHHRESNSNEDVKVVSISSSKVFYFPRGLEKFFINLDGIYIYGSRLKEIRAEDLKPFPKIRRIDLDRNNLQVIEANLFEYNSQLKYINLQGNEIWHIDPNVFNNFVDKLSFLRLSENICEIESALNDNKQKVNEVISIIKTGSCKDEGKLREFMGEASETTTTTTTISKPISQYDEMMEILLELKKMIKKQNRELKQVKEEVTESKVKLETLTEQISELRSKIQ